MIKLLCKENCCGCEACAQICPNQCICMTEDEEGFKYPLIDSANCIDCGMCKEVCPFTHENQTRNPISTFAAINQDQDQRLISSSGGVFYILAEKTIALGGIVFGAKYDFDWQVVFDYADTFDGVKAFVGSKYVQARINGSYSKCEEFLKSGRKVLFSGTPCQVSGLKRYLKRNYENLVLVDFACHGVPSPKVWRNYLREKQVLSSNISGIYMRGKNHGWRNYGFQITVLVGTKQLPIEETVAAENEYMRSFFQNLTLRPSCHSCKCKGFSSGSDLTLADFWGIWDIDKSMYDDKGTSLVFVHSDQGYRALDFSRMRYANTDFEKSVSYNSALFESVKPHRNRTSFFQKLNNVQSITQLIQKELRPIGLELLKTHVKLFLKRVNLLNR